MKRNTLKGKVYHKLIYKMYFQVCVVLGISVLFVYILRNLVRGKLADFIVLVIQANLRVPWEQAVELYQSYIRNNMDYIVIFFMVVFFLILLRLSIRWFARYFEQMVTGVEQLASESDTEIVMSPELAFMEEALNEAKDKLKKRAEEARLAEERKNELVVYLAHDIKTPLTSVIGYLSIMEEAPDMSQAQREKYVHIALEKAYRLEVLINEFFEITRYHLHSVPIDKTRLNLGYMMVQISDELYPQLSAQNKRVELDIDEEMTVWGDAEKLARVFNNILKNAISYSRDDSAIQVSAKEEGGGTAITIRNEGAIPQERLALIFEKFYRLDHARSTSTGGAGLGLAIAKDIVTLHGGEIRANSDGEHTEFTVALPAAPFTES